MATDAGLPGHASRYARVYEHLPYRPEDTYQFGALQEWAPGVWEQMRRGLLRNERGVGVGWDCFIPLLAMLGIFVMVQIFKPREKSRLRHS